MEWAFAIRQGRLSWSLKLWRIWVVPDIESCRLIKSCRRYLGTSCFSVQTSVVQEDFFDFLVLKVDTRTTLVWFSAEVRDYIYFLNSSTRHWSLSCLIVNEYRRKFTGIKPTRAWIWPLIPSIVEGKNVWSSNTYFLICLNGMHAYSVRTMNSWFFNKTAVRARITSV